MNSCILPCLRWVGQLRQNSGRVMLGDVFDKDVTHILFMLLIQATLVCTRGVREPRQMDVLLAFVAASLKWLPLT